MKDINVNKIHIGWVLWNRNTLDRGNINYSNLVLRSLNRVDFTRILSATNSKSYIRRNIYGVYEEYTIIVKVDCRLPLEVASKKPAIYTIDDYQEIRTGKSLYNLYDLEGIVFVDSLHGKQSYLDCATMYNKADLDAMHQELGKGWISLHDRVLIETL